MQNLKERKSIEGCTRKVNVILGSHTQRNNKTFNFLGVIEKLDERVYGKDYGLLLCLSFNCFAHVFHSDYIMIIHSYEALSHTIQ
jgi:hypothetical protein